MVSTTSKRRPFTEKNILYILYTLQSQVIIFSVTKFSLFLWAKARKQQVC